jgi:signal transduction histidine kinase
MTVLDAVGINLRQRAGAANRRAVLLSLGLLALLLALLATGERWYAEQLLVKQRMATAVEVRAYGQGLATVANSQVSRLHGLAGFVGSAASEEAIAVEFQTYVADLALISPGIEVMALAPEGVVAYVAATDDSAALISQDLRDDPEPEIRAAVAEAMGSEEPVLAGPLRLADGTLSLVATRAVSRNSEFWGLAQVRIDVATLLEEAGIRLDAGELALALRDSRSRVFAGNFGVFAQEPAETEIPVAGERWTLAGVPRGGWAAAIRGDLLLGRAAGLLLALLLSAVVYLMVDRQERLQQAVAWRTRELAEERALLEQRVEARTRELQTLLDVSRDVASTLEFPALLSALLDQLQKVVDFSGLAVYLFQNGDGLKLAQHHGPDEGQTQLPPWMHSGQAVSPNLRTLSAPLTIADVKNSPAEVAAWEQIIGPLDSGGPVVPASWMAVPLLLQNRLLGVLVFYHTTAGYYGRRRAQLAMAMANHVAVAIENARLYEQARSLAALQERQRLARELHDSVSQSLYGIGLGTHTVLELLERNGAEKITAELRPALTYTLSLAKAALAEMRALIFELRPESLEVEGLIPALARLGEVLQARREVTVEMVLEREPTLPVAAKEALYRIAQEALNNVAKHAQASVVTIRLTGGEDGTALEIGDDGIGFDPQGQFPGHLGLQSMRERVEGAGGSLAVTSAPGRGTTIRARIPDRLTL